jgi:hypothetical protein
VVKKYRKSIPILSNNIFQPSDFKANKIIRFWHAFCFYSKRIKTDSKKNHWTGKMKEKNNQEGSDMIQRESNRRAKHKAPKFKETQEEDLCWEDRREQHNQRKESDKKPYQKNRTKTKW